MAAMESQSVDIKVKGINILYYSLIQAGIPLIESIVLTNSSAETISRLRIRMETEFQFMEDMEIEVAEIEKNSFQEITPRLIFHARKIFELTERVSDFLKISLYRGEELWQTISHELSILPVTQWSGIRTVPESIASFVMPNIPEVNVIVAHAAGILQKQTGNPSFSGYLSGDKNQVMSQISSIYAAIYELGVNYNVLPASFETIGQRVRTPQDLYYWKQGNCLEMSILFASVCEAVGLNPFLVIVEGHAFAGCWLTDEIFDSTTEKNVEELLKRLAPGINDLIVVESTCMNLGNNKNFDRAIRAAEGHLLERERFVFAIDIRRCHLLGMTPLPVRITENGESKIIDYGYTKEAMEKAVVKRSMEDYFLDTTQKEEVTKSMVWMRNLLDLSKRNSLISFRPGLKNIQLFTENISFLEDELNKGEQFTLTEVTGSTVLNRKSVKIIDIENEKERIAEISKADFKAKKIRTFMAEEEMLYVLKSIYRETQRSLEENGASSLFLAMGFLKWIDPKDGVMEDGKPYFRYAPLVLVPVELQRKNLRTYSIRLRDEDSQMNITLLEFLRQKFEMQITGFNPLPEDESGVDIPLVLNSVRKAIMSQKGWDVLESAVLGHFSFSQFVMWNDLKDRFDRLTESPVVKGFIDGLYRSEHMSGWQEKDLDSQYKVRDIVIPTDIDSGQLAAVMEAVEGRSFVLHGPPGTGKSQTITNMITNALYQGKSVLFVAEKMAALNVVYERLGKIGLEDFCLEIHSNKTSRRTVLEKLESCLNLKAESEQNEYLRKSERVQKLKEKLNLELAELHKLTPQGYSVYELVSMLQEYEQPEEEIRFTEEELSTLKLDIWDDILQLMKVIGRTLAELSVPFSVHPLKDLRVSRYSYAEEAEFWKSVEFINSLLKEIRHAQEQNPKIQFSISGMERLAKLYRYGKEKNRRMDFSAEMLCKLSDPSFISIMETYRKDNESFQVLRSTVAAKYSNQIDHMDIAGIKGDYLQADSSFFFKSGKVKKSLLALNAISKNNHRLDAINAAKELDEISEYLDKKHELEERLQRLERELQYRFDEVQKNAGLAPLVEFGHLLQELNSNNIRNEELIDSMALISRMDDELRLMLTEKLPLLSGHLQTVSNFGKANLISAFRDAEGRSFLEKILRHWTEHRQSLKEMVFLYQNLDALDGYGFTHVKEDILEKLHQGTINPEKLENQYSYSLLNQLIQYHLERNKELSGFRQISTEERINEYNQLVSEIEIIGREQVKRSLIERLPNQRNLTEEESLELSGLMKVIRSKGRGTSIRKIFQSYSRMIKNLTPCLLMSPLSVAQYIDIDFPKFDLVIFDEASQIRTGVAVGALSRAKNCVVVGDPNQMPPTDFFSMQKLDEENIQMEDLESLLEDCLAINMPQKYLTCHYRSESESLIAFSNFMYYKNKMKTFPSPHDVTSKVSLRKIGGIYARGNTRTNRAEAEAIVKEIVRRLQDETLCKLTIGVVTFNATQQELIDDLLQIELAKHVDLEKAHQAMREPIFIKNLENVQGDERDVILFSVTYGRDENGKFFQNFGPLGKKGGWRRLNVAVTRSRVEMVVFSSISYAEFNIGAATSEGVIGLQKFLEFAEKGFSALRTSTKRSQKESPQVLKSIQKFLAMEGYESQIQFGESDLSLEIAVKNPKNPNHYLCAILLDGKQYYGMNTTRDRNRMLPSVLNRKGWNLYRIWTLTYFEQKDKVLNELKGYLDSLVQQYIETVLDEEISK